MSSSIKQSNINQDTDNRISFVTSRPIHPLGIRAGERITVDYEWEQLYDFFLDLNNSCFRIVIKSEDELEEVFIVSGIDLELEDIFTEDHYGEDQILK